MSAPFEVLVGNIGTVYTGSNYMQACSVFGIYVEQSRSGQGRAAGDLAAQAQQLRQGAGDRAGCPRHARRQWHPG